VEVSCPKCSRRLLIEDARVPPGPFTIRCPQCQATISLNGRPPVSNEVAASAAAPPPPPSTASVSPAPPPAAWPSAAPSQAPLPGTEGAAPEMTDLLCLLVQRKASDLHLCTGSPPMIRVDGEIEILTGRPAMTSAESERLLLSVAPPRSREEFAERHDTDFAYEIPGVARYRCNLFRDRKGAGGVFRVIPSKIMTAEDMALPKELLEVCHLPKGLVLVTGPTGSGKSTTLSALVDYVNRQRSDHIVTIEDPLEFVHENKKCLVNQRQVGLHTSSFTVALRAALREDPDIVLLGEMRDLETMAIAIETAETGHLVFGTLHTSSASSTVDRIINQFPADRQQQVRVMLAESLRAVVSQVLCRKIGGGRVAALEILIATPPVCNLIREAKTFQIPSLMQTGRKHGMALMNDSLLDLVKRGLVAPEEAFAKTVDKASLLALYKRAGVDVSWAPKDAAAPIPA
jgi:twitching motility protein PilT